MHKTSKFQFQTTPNSSVHCLSTFLSYSSYAALLLAQAVAAQTNRSSRQKCKTRMASSSHLLLGAAVLLSLLAATYCVPGLAIPHNPLPSCRTYVTSRTCGLGPRLLLPGAGGDRRVLPVRGAERPDGRRDRAGRAAGGPPTGPAGLPAGGAEALRRHPRHGGGVQPDHHRRRPRVPLASRRGNHPLQVINREEQHLDRTVSQKI